MNQNLSNRFDTFKKSVLKVSTHESILDSQAKNLEDEVEKAKYKSELYVKCSEIFKKWLEDSITKNVDSISDLATTGLKFIIQDQDLKFSIKQEAKYNRISMKFIVEQDGVEGDPLDSYGGGAAVIISLILRIAIMQKMGMCDLLILDESMVALANAYVPFAASFMRQLSEQTGVNILMVTHNPEFVMSAHTAYEGVKDSSLTLRKLGTSF